MIKIWNKRAKSAGGMGPPPADAVLVDRSSPLGNPFVMRTEAERASVCDQYDNWLQAQVLDQDSPARAALFELAGRYQREGRLTLVCWCAPRRCHAESVAAAIKAMCSDTPSGCSVCGDTREPEGWACPGCQSV